MNFSELDDTWVLPVLDILNADGHCTAPCAALASALHMVLQALGSRGKKGGEGKEPRAHKQEAARFCPLGPRKGVTHVGHGPLKTKVT